MSDFLEKICVYKKELVKTRKMEIPDSLLFNRVRQNPAAKSFSFAIQQATRKGYALIAEIKRASPSGGLIRTDFNPKEIAKSYENAGATCLSILTDERYFKGHDTDLSEVKKVVSLPCLRKDFLVDTYQVIEARALGADAILLIVAAVEDALARDIENVAFDLGMDVLVEVHNESELERALTLKSKLLGINNRNLKTLKTDIATTERLVSMVPDGHILISESGLQTSKDLARMAKCGARSFLVGESLLRQPDLEEATSMLLMNPVPPS